jgi:hypothetical protein
MTAIPAALTFVNPIKLCGAFADYCRKLDGALETVSIPFEKNRGY